MCGIVGFINCGNSDSLYRSTKIIDHRGPDALKTKWFKKHNSGFGHARLSIIDLSKNGDQPFYDPNFKTWIVFNGELYNYENIKFDLEKRGHVFLSNSDTEVVLKAFNEWGKDCLKKFNGMFAFSIFNENSGEVFLCRDRLGIKPLYYFVSNGQMVFASEIKAIIESKIYEKKVDWKSMHTSIHFQASPVTGFKNIKKIEAGNYAIFKNGFFETKEYWNVEPTEALVDYNEAYNELDFLINDSIKLNMISDVKIGALLSGGLDSSLICVLMQKYLKEPINTFTIKFEESDLKKQGNVNDAYYADIVSRQFGFNHQNITLKPDVVNLIDKIVWHLEEPIADPSAINTYLISKAARENGIKVLLSGMGADEVFSGYRSHLACILADGYNKYLPNIIKNNLKRMVSILPHSSSLRDFKYIRWLKSWMRVAGLTQFERAISISNSALTSNEFRRYYLNDYALEDSNYYKRYKKYFNQYDTLSYLTKLCFCDTKIYLSDHNLTYSDKAMMAAGVEGRPPLIDHRIVEYMFKLNPSFRIKFFTQKFILKKISEKYLPKKIIYRPKAPFSAPMRGWLKKELREFSFDLLSFDSVTRRGIYNPHYVQKLLKDNLNGYFDNSQLIWRLMINEIWFRKYFN